MTLAEVLLSGLLPVEVSTTSSPLMSIAGIPALATVRMMAVVVTRGSRGMGRAIGARLRRARGTGWRRTRDGHGTVPNGC